jgi:hypothetical protein
MGWQSFEFADGPQTVTEVNSKQNQTRRKIPSFFVFVIPVTHKNI